MRTISVEVDTGYVNCIHRFTFEVDDDATEEEIDELAAEGAWDCISVTWKEIK